MSVLEAYALGKPVIGARIGGIPELIRENQTGMSFVSGDEASLSAVLRDTIRHTDAAIEEMGRCARRWVEVEFTADAYRRRILEVYGELGVKMPNETAVAGERISGSGNSA
jgi:glycosyltransferase involved in cell wall biosynthesis